MDDDLLLDPPNRQLLDRLAQADPAELWSVAFEAVARYHHHAGAGLLDAAVEVLGRPKTAPPDPALGARARDDLDAALDEYGSSVQDEAVALQLLWPRAIDRPCVDAVLARLGSAYRTAGVDDEALRAEAAWLRSRLTRALGAPYDDQHPMVWRLRQIFGDPRPPAVVTQRQFDGDQRALEALARKAWSEIGRSSADIGTYLLDLCYQPLQQDLFDYVFPAFLLRWWEGQRNRYGGPEAACDFYRAIDRGAVFDRWMSPARRAAVFDWMADAYIDGVDAWSGALDPNHTPHGPSDLQGPLMSFHALGQSVPIFDRIWAPLCDVVTPGRAQWWLVLATGLAFGEDECPAIPGWTPTGGGGGVYVLGSASAIDHAYLPANLAVVRASLDARRVEDQLERATATLVKRSELEWAAMVKAAIEADRELFALRMEVFLDYLAQPELGGMDRTW